MRRLAPKGTICTVFKRWNTHEGALLLVKWQAELCNFTKSNILPCFSRFLNCTNGTKQCKASQMPVLKLI